MSGEYPEEEDLEKIKEWKFDDFVGWMEFIKSIWWVPAWGWSEDEGIYSISTGGWSGNESIISAMHHNFALWGIHWHNHRAGGHYEFKTREALDAWRNDVTEEDKAEAAAEQEAVMSHLPPDDNTPCWGCGATRENHPDESGCQSWHRDSV